MFSPVFLPSRNSHLKRLQFSATQKTYVTHTKTGGGHSNRISIHPPFSTPSSETVPYYTLEDEHVDPNKLAEWIENIYKDWLNNHRNQIGSNYQLVYDSCSETLTVKQRSIYTRPSPEPAMSEKPSLNKQLYHLFGNRYIEWKLKQQSRKNQAYLKEPSFFNKYRAELQWLYRLINRIKYRNTHLGSIHNQSTEIITVRTFSRSDIEKRLDGVKNYNDDSTYQARCKELQEIESMPAPAAGTTDSRIRHQKIKSLRVTIRYYKELSERLKMALENFDTLVQSL